MPKATAKRLLFWCPFAGFIGYYFSATDAMIDSLIVLSVCVMMFEASYLVFLSDKRTRRLKPTILGVGTSTLCILSMIMTGTSAISLTLFSVTALSSLWLWLSLKDVRSE
jgi:hypothetical protein